MNVRFPDAALFPQYSTLPTTKLTLHFVDRTQRVKAARTEAQKEIDDYRKQKDQEFQEFEKKVYSPLPLPDHRTPYDYRTRGANAIGVQHTSGNKKAEDDASKDAEEQIKAIKQAGEKKGDQVVNDLLRVVGDVRPQVPDRGNMAAA